MPQLSLPSALLLVGASLLSASVGAAEATGCAAKREHLQQQIEVAKAQGNSARQAGLEEALSQVTANCTDASLQQEREAKVQEAEAEVRTREAELKEAQAKGDAEKIAKREAKLTEARDELHEAQEALQR